MKKTLDEKRDWIRSQLDTKAKLGTPTLRVKEDVTESTITRPAIRFTRVPLGTLATSRLRTSVGQTFSLDACRATRVESEPGVWNVEVDFNPVHTEETPPLCDDLRKKAFGFASGAVTTYLRTWLWRTTIAGFAIGLGGGILIGVAVGVWFL